MSEQTTFPGHPDAAFAPSKKKESVPKGGAIISAEIAALAASLAVPIENGEYTPDAFVRAIKARHDTLVDVTRTLTEQNERQRAKQRELEARERAVALREQKVTAIEALTPGGKSSWWKLGR